MSANYSFHVQIDPATAQSLIDGGYYLAVQKATPGSTTAVQWITFQVKGTGIDVTWVPEYGIFFTSTTIISGATIVQGTQGDADLGYAYNYIGASFPKAGAGVPAGITITNKVTDTVTLGLSQAYIDPNTGNKVRSPIAVATNIISQFAVTFSPTEKVTLYFRNSYTQGGTAIDISGPTISKVITPGVQAQFGFKDGVWTDNTGSLAKFALAKTPDVGQPFNEYRVSLAGPLSQPAVENYFSTLLLGETVIVSGSGSVYQLLVFGPDPAKKLQDAVSKEIDDLYKIELGPGYYELHGTGAIIDSIIPAPSHQSVLWNAVFKHPQSELWNAVFKHAAK